MLHARDLYHLTVLNVRAQMSLQTFFAELVVTGKTEELSKFLLFIADLTKKVVFTKRFRLFHVRNNINYRYTVHEWKWRR